MFNCNGFPARIWSAHPKHTKNSECIQAQVTNVKADMRTGPHLRIFWLVRFVDEPLKQLYIVKISLRLPWIDIWAMKLWSLWNAIDHLVLRRGGKMFNSRQFKREHLFAGLGCAMISLHVVLKQQCALHAIIDLI